MSPHLVSPPCPATHQKHQFYAITLDNINHLCYNVRKNAIRAAFPYLIFARAPS